MDLVQRVKAHKKNVSLGNIRRRKQVFVLSLLFSLWLILNITEEETFSTSGRSLASHCHLLVKDGTATTAAENHNFLCNGNITRLQYI